MPGTIQVSVLEFKGLHSSSPSSQTSVKDTTISSFNNAVSMGKREYQTWDKGEFSFPLTTLRDNLIITLQDAEGNEISHTGVETKLVVEKGFWDDVFTFEGGGHVHMKLQFVLSEDERQRIRIMRESAMKKKHDELSSSGHGSPRSASIGYSEVSGSPESSPQSKLLATEAILASVPFSKVDIGNRERSHSIQKQKNTVKTGGDENGGNTSAKSILESCNQDSVPSEVKKYNNSEKQWKAGKTNSNVRKMITAFEGSRNQDVKPSIKPPPPIKKSESDSFLANSHLNEVDTENTTSSKVTLRRVYSKEFEQTKTSTRENVKTFGFVKPTCDVASSKETGKLEILYLKNRFKVKQKEIDWIHEKEEKKYSEDLRRASTLEKPTFSRRMLDKHSKGNQSWNLFSKKQHSSRSLVTNGGGEEIFQKDPQEAETNSCGELNDHCSIGSSDLWIFPGQAKCLCITTGGKQAIDLTGGFWDERNTHQRELRASDPKNTGEVNTGVDIANKANEDAQTSKELRPKVENIMNHEGAIGPVRQVIRVVVMVGFAALVILTRKRR